MREPNWDALADQKLNTYLDQVSRSESDWESFIESEEYADAESKWQKSDGENFEDSSECESAFEAWCEWQEQKYWDRIGEELADRDRWQ